MQALWTISFFEVRNHKVRKVTDPFLLHYEIVNGLLTFCKNNMFGKNLVLELWSKNLKANQNAGFFKLEHLTNKLKYEVEFLGLNRGP